MRTLFVALVLSSQLVASAVAKTMYIPAAALTPGLNSTFWRTDLRIFNPSTVGDIDVAVHFLPQGQNGLNPTAGRTFHIRKRETLVLDNAIASLAPGAANAVGALRIDSGSDASADFIASSRTYTESTETARPGTYGQFVAAVGQSEARSATAVLLVTSRPQFRTNIGVMNPSTDSVSVKVTLLGTDGLPLLESSRRIVPPRTMQQWSMNDLFGTFFMRDGTAIIEATVPVFSWASVVDNYSGDAVFVRGVDVAP